MDYVKYLTNLRMIGPFDSFLRDDGSQSQALLVSVDTALEECIGYFKEDISRSSFLSYLKGKDILVFGNIEDFVKWKKVRIDPSKKKKFKRNISEERKLALKKHAESIRDKIRPTTSRNH